jgi:hypothetical protein
MVCKIKERRQKKINFFIPLLEKVEQNNNNLLFTLAPVLD